MLSEPRRHPDLPVETVGELMAFKKGKRVKATSTVLFVHSSGDIGTVVEDEGTYVIVEWDRTKNSEDYLTDFEKEILDELSDGCSMSTTRARKEDLSLVEA